MSIKIKLSAVIILTICFFNSVNSQPSAATFIGGGGDNYFSTAANWDPAGVPASGSDITISTGSTMVIDMDFTCNRLTLTYNASFNCTGGHTLTVTDAILDGNGNVRVDINSSLIIGSGMEVYNPEPTSGTFTDSRDSHVYKWVKIGTQIWMAENLAFNTYGGCWAYNNDEGNVATYGRLYDWPTSMNGASSSSTNPSGVKGVCPTGWHLPSSVEWNILFVYLGYDEVGCKLKESGTAHWYDPNSCATNESGFTALPGGAHSLWGFDADIEFIGYWWSSTAGDIGPWMYSLGFNRPVIYGGEGNNGYGLSIRCVKD